ncbi:hypothetical protein ZIOFF_001147 [Zingiber officinale]|uniref:Flap endonuclease 1 n=1 Tax=Zingiber officinale TaxID=94328 RepID=A0A8J5LUU6_ZINOF|nr:hypothetical protein ZIOFF_001147 [Zingiber officinale]
MGIKGLTKLLADHAPKAIKEQKFENYFGQKIAIDASMSIYQFLIVARRTGMETLTNQNGKITRNLCLAGTCLFLHLTLDIWHLVWPISHLQWILNRTIRFLEAGIKPVYVFDGQPPELKKQGLAKRQVFTDLYSKREDATKDLNTTVETGDLQGIEKYSKRTIKVTKQHNEDCKRLLRLMGVPTIEAPCEAEAQCAALCKSDKAYAVASEDMDSLTYGAPRFLRQIMDPSSKKTPVMEFEVSKVLEELELTMDQFIDLCILSGCDYCDSIKGKLASQILHTQQV